MRRVPHGGTTRPPMERPGSGFGRRPVKLGPSERLQAYAAKSRKRVRDFSWLLAVSLDD
jgi:hypothetical protein